MLPLVLEEDEECIVDKELSLATVNNDCYPMRALSTVGRGEREDSLLVTVDNEGWRRSTMKVEIILKCTVEQHKGFYIMDVEWVIDSSHLLGRRNEWRWG